MVKWEQYDYCDQCERPAGAPCRDLRYAKRMGEFSRDQPHAGRPLLKWETKD